VLACCLDFDNATSKDVEGLVTPHVLRLPVPIAASFSSSSSLHCFFLSACGRRLWAMGKNDRGQLGLGVGASTATVTHAVEVGLGGVLASAKDVVVKVATGRYHTVLLLNSGAVWGAGANSDGQLGTGGSKTAAKDSLAFVKLSTLYNVTDVACGHDFSLACDRDGRLFAWGSPQFGQLGTGTDGSFFQEGKRGMQHDCEVTPRQVTRFVQRDSHDRVTAELSATTVKVGRVAAGKNHSIVVEADGDGGLGRVFSCGSGGYGRLGHNTVQDELVFREITHFHQLVQGKPVQPPTNPAKWITEVFCGSTFTLAVSKNHVLYFWGKLSNSPRGEATIYPQPYEGLQGVRRLGRPSPWLTPSLPHTHLPPALSHSHCRPPRDRSQMQRRCVWQQCGGCHDGHVDSGVGDAGGGLVWLGRRRQVEPRREAGGRCQGLERPQRVCRVGARGVHREHRRRRRRRRG